MNSDKPSPSSSARMPLSGLRVLDLSRVLAGPFAAQLLGDLGAEVIKVERAGAGDDSRKMGPPFLKDLEGRDTRESPILLGTNRKQKSITLDLAKPEGQEIVRRLAAMSDVVVENFKVGDLKRYGLDHESLRAVTPRLVYCSVTGFGQSGPYAPRPGYDSIFQAMGGLMSVTGYPDEEGGAPVKTGPSIADFIGGQFAAIGVISALYARDAQRGGRPACDQHGRGQQVDIALLDSVIASLTHYTAQYLATGVVPVRRGTQGNGGLPSQAFPCADGSIMVVCGNDEQYRRFCHALGRPDLATDPRFETNPLRVGNRRLLTETFNEITRTWEQRDLLSAMDRAGVPAGPIYDLKQVFEDPQVQHRGMSVEVPHPLSGTVKIAANPIKLSDTPIERYIAPPTTGQHTSEVLKDLLAMSDDELARLSAARII
ncbi:CaiB/BaiF CoA-transferase family protein [Ideonella sp. B508-1]|uniref:CaiB/BaiF CoA transferase family protein n=1 Tax=Ideonella sp. B508-1 TaxID=137716 RepID=UPI000348F0DF|nr:CoA transferase [Ideonella sp. B508-1]